MINTKYLVLGTGAAALYAVLGIRTLDQTGGIIMVGREHELPYRRPMLSKSPMRTLRADATQIYPASWYAEHGVTVMTGTEVLSIDEHEQIVRTDGGDIAFEKCIYALGAQNFIPPFEGADLDGVVSIRTTDDLRAVKKYAALTDNAVVIGGGVIGLEMAIELQRYGMNVTVLEAMPRLMPRQLDEPTSRRLEQMCNGFSIHTGVSIAAICGDDRVRAVTLADGRRFDCGLVIGCSYFFIYR